MRLEIESKQNKTTALNMQTKLNQKKTDVKKEWCPST